MAVGRETGQEKIDKKDFIQGGYDNIVGVIWQKGSSVWVLAGSWEITGEKRVGLA